MKFKLSRALKISSVNLVQNLISVLDPPNPSRVKKKLVHKPTQEYIGKKGTLFSEQKRYRPDIKANVKPVGAIKAIGCPQKRAYA